MAGETPAPPPYGPTLRGLYKAGGRDTFFKSLFSRSRKWLLFLLLLLPPTGRAANFETPWDFKVCIKCAFRFYRGFWLLAS
jgi:hypothetical protein